MLLLHQVSCKSENEKRIFAACFAGEGTQNWIENKKNHKNVKSKMKKSFVVERVEIEVKKYVFLHVCVQVPVPCVYHS